MALPCSNHPCPPANGKERAVGLADALVEKVVRVAARGRLNKADGHPSAKVRYCIGRGSKSTLACNTFRTSMPRPCNVNMKGPPISLETEHAMLEGGVDISGPRWRRHIRGMQEPWRGATRQREREIRRVARPLTSREPSKGVLVENANGKSGPCGKSGG